MTLGQKLAKLRALEGYARGLGRELTQNEVAKGIRDDHGGQISQSYLSQLENGARTHMTSTSRLLLARFFRVHPGYLVDDPEDMPAHLPIKPRRKLDDELDLWLIEGSEEFARDPELSHALVRIAKHEQSRECLILLGAIVENKVMIQRLIERLTPAPMTRKRRRATEDDL
jgi:transcriptional regulator with XRE-family HTH domain